MKWYLPLTLLTLATIIPISAMEKGNRDDRSTKWDELDAGFADMKKLQDNILADYVKCRELAARGNLSPELQAELEKCHKTAGNTAALLQELIEYRDGGTPSIESLFEKDIEERNQKTKVFPAPAHSNASDSRASTNTSSSPLLATHEPRRSIFHQWLNRLFCRQSQHDKQD